MNKKHVGSSLDVFLSNDGILEEVEEVATKRRIAIQVKQLMREKKVTKTEMSQRMKTSRAALERLLDPTNESITLQTLHRAARALGKHLEITLV